MENRNVGLLMIGLAALTGIITISFNRALKNIVSSACTHGSVCPMWGTITLQTNISIGIIALVVAFGLYLIFIEKESGSKTVSKKNYPVKQANLANDEKQLLEKIIESEGTIFQSELVDKTKFTKVKVTRILDKLEGKGLIERKRRGMTNVVVLKIAHSSD